MAVKDYKTNPDLNTTISGINIAEGCPPSGINNAIRQLMADVKQNADEQSTEFSKVMTGATASSAGTSGKVPSPQAGEQSFFLNGAGHWVEPFFIRASNPISSVSQDTVSKWIELGSGVFWINVNNILNGQPSQYGFLINYSNGGDIFQIWKTQSSGNMYERSGTKNEGWTKTFSMIIENSDLEYYVSQKVASYLPKAGGTMSGGIDMNGNNIGNLNNLNGRIVHSGGYNSIIGTAFQAIRANLEGGRRYFLKTATGLLIDSNTVAININKQANISFYSPFIAKPFVFFSVVGRTGGYNPYIISVSTTGFSIGWETFGSAQSGASAYLHYLAIGPEQTL